MKKRYDQLQERAETFFESTIEYYLKEFRSSQKYSNLDYCGPASMKLNST